MQRLARERNASAATIGGIADQRVSKRGHMHADLMRAPRFQSTGKQSANTEMFSYFVMRHRRLTCCDDRHRGTPHRMPADRRIDASRLGHVPMDQCQKFPAHSAALELSDEIGL